MGTDRYHGLSQLRLPVMVESVAPLLQPVTCVHGTCNTTGCRGVLLLVLCVKGCPPWQVHCS